jgi:AraC-like DNA-binding protein
MGGHGRNASVHVRSSQPSGVRLDVFSDALAVLRTGEPVATCTDVRAPFSLQFPAIGGAGFHLLLRGHCVLIPPDGEPIRLDPGDVVFLRHGSRYILCSDPAVRPEDFTHDRVDRSSSIGRITLDGPGERCVLACGAYKLDMTRPHPLLAGLPGVIHLPAGPGQYPPLRATVGQLTEEMDAPRPGSDSVVHALIDLMLLQIMRAWYDGLPEGQAEGWAAAVTDPVIAPALQAIHDEPGRSWTVDALRRRSGLSRAAFARRFTAVVGEPPLSYLTSWRMTAARRLLRESDAPLSAVAARSGYGSEFAFAKAFKRAYGIAPGGYRRQARRQRTDEQASLHWALR